MTSGGMAYFAARSVIARLLCVSPYLSGQAYHTRSAGRCQVSRSRNAAEFGTGNKRKAQRVRHKPFPRNLFPTPRATFPRRATARACAESRFLCQLSLVIRDDDRLPTSSQGPATNDQ
jgi:hypothetical protein